MHLQRARVVFDKPEDPKGAPATAPVVAEVVVEPKPEPVVVAEPVVVKPEPKVEPKPEPKVEPKKDWKDARIAELTAKLNKKETPAATGAPGEAEAAFQERVNAAAAEKAVELAALADWNQRCVNIADTGRAAFPDFNDRLAALHGIVNGEDLTEVTQYNEVLATMMETGKAPQLIYSLGENPGEYKRLMGLSPVKRAMELASMAAKLESDPEPSAAPKPITPVGSSGLHYEGIKPDDPKKGMKLPMKEWMEQREKQARAAGIQ